MTAHGPDPVARVLDRIAVLAPGGAFGVAVSGGGDSMALLAIAARFSPGRTVSACTVDHGLRPEARAEAALVAAFCDERGIAHEIMAANLASATGNLPARARAARYGLLADWAKTHGLATVLLAHTIDDQAETVLMRLARGSGVDGLSAMAPLREWAGIRWIRPMLNEHRADLRVWLRSEGIRWCEDPSNDDPSYDRTRVRAALEVLAPLGIGIRELAGTAERLRRQRAVLEDAEAALWSRCARWGALGEIFIAAPPMFDARRELGLRVLARGLMAAAGAAYRPRFRSLEPVFEALATEGVIRTLSGCRLHRRGDEIEIVREPVAQPAAPLRAGMQIWDGRWQIDVPATLPGASIAALGKDIAPLAGPAPPAWQAASRHARMATPTIRDSAGTVLAVPAACLCVDPRLDGVRAKALETGGGGAAFDLS